jgi:hypothetical protein
MKLETTNDIKPSAHETDAIATKTGDVPTPSMHDHNAASQISVQVSAQG